VSQHSRDGRIRPPLDFVPHTVMRSVAPWSGEPVSQREYSPPPVLSFRRTSVEDACDMELLRESLTDLWSTALSGCSAARSRIRFTWAGVGNGPGLAMFGTNPLWAAVQRGVSLLSPTRALAQLSSPELRYFSFPLHGELALYSPPELILMWGLETGFPPCYPFWPESWSFFTRSPLLVLGRVSFSDPMMVRVRSLFRGSIPRHRCHPSRGVACGRCLRYVASPEVFDRPHGPWHFAFRHPRMRHLLQAVVCRILLSGTPALVFSRYACFPDCARPFWLANLNRSWRT
jgi:hypothetical protein